MSDRDYFATHADMALLWDNVNMNHLASLTGLEPARGSEPLVLAAWWFKCETTLRYMFADAMIQARAATQGKS